MSKRDKIAYLVADILAMQETNTRFDLVNNLCAVIWQLSKGTKQETDCKELVEKFCPEFFKEIK